MRDKDFRTTYPKIQYNLYRRSFDVKTHNFGEEELVYDAASDDKSVTLPRISPDGRYLLFALGQYGCFHSRHHDADNYSRVYFSYFHDGKAEKAFLMPQEDPEFHTFLLKSYNRPEFMVEPVKISVDEFSKVFEK